MEVDSTIISDDDEGSELHGSPCNEDVDQNEWPQRPDSDAPIYFNWLV